MVVQSFLVKKINSTTYRYSEIYKVYIYKVREMYLSELLKNTGCLGSYVLSKIA